MKKLPSQSPPCTGGGCATLKHREAFLHSSLPLCKGETVRVVGKLKDKKLKDES